MFAEDLTAFFSIDEFATAATYKVGGSGSGVTKNVIFDRASLEQLGVSNNNPTALAIASEFATWGTTDTLTIGGTVYRIADGQLQDDGALIVFVLEKA